MQPSDVLRDTQARSFGYGDGASREIARPVACEVPVNIVYEPTPFAVMMATPADLEDFAVGFSLTEGVVDTIKDIRSIRMEQAEQGMRLIIVLTAKTVQRHLARKRSLAGRTGCGLCGIEDLGQLPLGRAVPPLDVILETAAIGRALKIIESHQPLNQATRAVHAAAWCDLSGDVLLVREDVGRHNALDKLIGAMARSGDANRRGFLLITSRCSFEMVEKAAMSGVCVVVAMSAPTSLAIERARLHGMTLVAVARQDGAMAFTGEQRLRFGDKG